MQENQTEANSTHSWIPHIEANPLKPKAIKKSKLQPALYAKQ